MARRPRGARVAQLRQEVVGEAHEGERHADDAAVVVRRDLHVAALDGQADQAAGAEEHAATRRARRARAALRARAAAP